MSRCRYGILMISRLPAPTDPSGIGCRVRIIYRARWAHSLSSALAAYERRSALPFATIDRVSKKAVGSTRFHHIEIEHRRAEIGVTWIGTAFQRSYVNTETKFLQLWYSFEILNCRRVEFKADVDNKKSITAILRLGATKEGIFRKHMLYADGRNRDNIYFSIIDDEWPIIQAQLQARLGYAVAPRIIEATAT